MKKPDTILRQTTIAAIKRKAMIPHKWELTRFYEADTVDDLAPFQDELNLRENELPVASTIVRSTEWTLITTRKVIGRTAKEIVSINIEDIEQWSWGDFKGRLDEPTTTMTLTTSEGQKEEFVIEGGKASMVMIYAVKTLLQQLSGENRKTVANNK